MIALTLLMLIVGGAALYWLIGRYVYQTNQNKAQDETIELLEKKKQDIAALKPNFDAIKAQGAGGKSEAELILNAMPTDEGFRQFVGMIENMAQKTNVRVSSLSKPGAGAGGAAAAVGLNSGVALPSGVQSSQVSVPVEGSFNNVIAFLKATENSSRVMDFVSMSIESTTGNVSVSPTFKIYWQAPANIQPTQRELQ
jgi:Tfp pilus assembly protein PilO